MHISNIIFVLLLFAGIFLFVFQIKKIIRNIKLGKKLNRSDRKKKRLKKMFLVAIGQSKMIDRPIAGLLHIIVYLGFIIVNIEIVEILIDGIFGTHRFLVNILGDFYPFMIGVYETFAIGVILACTIFLIRRNILKIKRFWHREMTSWPRLDANLILIFEILLMLAFLIMNASDIKLIQFAKNPNYLNKYALENYNIANLNESNFVFSKYLINFFPSNPVLLYYIERSAWWFHIIGILAFLNYIPKSKHFHLFIAFPNVYYSKLSPLSKFNNLENVSKEVKIMMNPNADPYATTSNTNQQQERFGAKDVTDLTWVQLMNAMACTECGRCSSECPATITGKKLSPRKIMMDTRDRLEEVSKIIDKKGKFEDDGKSLLGDYISPEELWACTTCNACSQVCPVNIDPVSIIIDLRRYLIMEEAKVPNDLAMMMTNIENNGAPWQFSPADRFKWSEEKI